MLTTLGKMNWPGLLAYTIQPDDMDLFQQYCFAQSQNRLSAERGIGVIYGCSISIVAGMQIQIAAGLLVMPDGTLVQMPALRSTLANGNGANPRIDRIEVAYTATNNTAVTSVTGQDEILDILYVASLNVVQGTPGSSPTIPAATSTNVSVASVTVPTSATSLNSGNLSQVVDYDFGSSPLTMDTNGWIRFNRTISAFQISSNAGVTWNAIIQTPVPEGSVSIANNQSSNAPISGMILDISQGTSFKISFDCIRSVTGTLAHAFGELSCFYDSVNGFQISPKFDGDDVGLTFALTQIGSSSVYQLNYISTNISGSAYAGTFKFSIVSFL